MDENRIYPGLQLKKSKRLDVTCILFKILNHREFTVSCGDHLRCMWSERGQRRFVLQRREREADEREASSCQDRQKNSSLAMTWFSFFVLCWKSLSIMARGGIECYIIKAFSKIAPCGAADKVIINRRLHHCLLCRLRRFSIFFAWSS